MSATMKRLRYLLFLASALLFLQNEARIGASPRPEGCNTVCGTAVACETECWNFDDVGFLTTCGEYRGGGGSGMCLGYCGDYFCNPDNNETYGSGPNDCPDDCGFCGDGMWQYAYEDLGNCPVDTHRCPDSACSGTWENCGNCPQDCGSCGGGGYTGGSEPPEIGRAHV
jgi:hypothetical protein